MTDRGFAVEHAAGDYVLFADYTAREEAHKREVHELRRERDKAEAESDSRRRALFEKGDEARREWQRAEAAEARALAAEQDAQRFAFFFDSNRRPSLGLGAMLMDDAKYTLDDWRDAIDAALREGDPHAE